MRKIFSFLFLVPCILSAQNDALFETQDIKLTGKVYKYEIIDLNGDSLKEIIAFTEEGKSLNSKKYINILWQTETGFLNDKMQKFAPHRETILFDFGNLVPETPGREFVLLMNDGIYCYALESNQKYDLTKKLIIKTSSIFKNRDVDDFIYWDFVKDINRNWKDEILIPQFNNYLVYAYSDSGTWEILSQLRLPSKTNINSHRNISVSYSPKDLYFADCNTDDLIDIITLEKDNFSIFYQQENGSYSTTPDLNFNMEFFKDEEKVGEEIVIQFLKDINDDGIIDMLASKISARESIFNPQSQIQIYFGKLQKDRLFSLTPDQIIVSSGVQFEHKLIDFNNDSKIDLAIPSIKLGLLRIIKILLTKQVTLDVSIYKMNENGLYPEKPDLEKNLTINFDFSINESSAEGSGTTPVFRLNGDFDGVGLLDLISAVDQRKFEIYKGDSDKIFSRTADLKVEVNLPKNGDDVAVYDLDNNGKSDIIIRYRKQDDKSGELQKLIKILMNRME